MGFGSGIRKKTYRIPDLGSRGSKRHRIPDPQHWKQEPYLGEHVSQNLHHGVHQPAKESRLGVQLLRGVADGAAQDTAQDVAAAHVVRAAAVRQGDGEGASVVGQHAVRHVHAVCVLLPHLPRVGSHSCHT
jgi:hypothetical protein